MECSRCRAEKQDADFGKCLRNKGGQSIYCKQCECDRTAQYRKRPGVKEKIKQWTKEYYRRAEVKAMPSLKAYRQRYYKQDHIREKQNSYSKLPNVRKRARERESARKANDPRYRFLSVLKTHIAGSLRGAKGRQKWEGIVGYSLNELRGHIEGCFLPGMAWENYGKWHVDHIIPISAFNFAGPEDFDFKRCWALKNLQPMWAKENISKGARLQKPFQPCLL